MAVNLIVGVVKLTEKWATADSNDVGFCFYSGAGVHQVHYNASNVSKSTH